jgi:hypothetical protein
MIASKVTDGQSQISSCQAVDENAISAMTAGSMKMHSSAAGLCIGPSSFPFATSTSTLGASASATSSVACSKTRPSGNRPNSNSDRSGRNWSGSYESGDHFVVGCDIYLCYPYISIHMQTSLEQRGGRLYPKFSSCSRDSKLVGHCRENCVR